MRTSVGKSIVRVDAFDKATGRAKYTDDLCDRSALVAKIVHSTVGNGLVTAVDTSEAEKIPGVVKVLTCFDVPDNPFPTAGHPWSTDPHHQDVADRLLLNRRVRYYGDDVAVVVAENEVAAVQAARAVKVSYEEYPVLLDVFDAMKEDATQLHEGFPGNILAHTGFRNGDYEKAIQEPGLIRVEGWYDTPTVQHCHIENHICFAYMEAGRVIVTASTQIPHIIRRIVGQALGIPWGKVRIIKPYIGGGFGNKQDALYEPLCAWLTTQVGGRLVKLDCAREETFVSNRVRHAIRTHIISWVRPDGSFAARKIECYSNQGAYASHGHGVGAKGMNCFPQLYPCANVEGDCWTVYTNRPAAGAMRGYGIPQAMFAGESHIDDIAKTLGIPPLEYRNRFVMHQGYVDGFTKNENYYDTFRQVLEKGEAVLDYQRKWAAVSEPDRPRPPGRGHAPYSGTTPPSGPSPWSPAPAAWSSTRTAPSRCRPARPRSARAATPPTARWPPTPWASPFADVHIVSTQDTDVTPFGLGAYASRQTYIGGFSIKQTGQLLKERILTYAQELTRHARGQPGSPATARSSACTDGRELMTLGELATEALYSHDPLGAHHRREHLPDQDQRLLLRLHLRRGGGGHPPVQGEAPGHGQRPRLRHAHQPGPGRGPGPRRHVHGHRLRPHRGAEVRPQDRPRP